jgi:hypothetical protein
MMALVVLGNDQVSGAVLEMRSCISLDVGGGGVLASF